MKVKIIYQDKKFMNLFNGQSIFENLFLLHRYLDRYLQRFEDELEQIDLKNQIGQRQKTPQYASRKALIESTINAERHEYETNGIGKSIFYILRKKKLILFLFRNTQSDANRYCERTPVKTVFYLARNSNYTLRFSLLEIGMVVFDLCLV